MKLDYTVNNFAALDRFGRVKDQIWTDYGSDPDVPLDQYHYTYDRAGNRLTRENVLNGDLSETYEYNALDELRCAFHNDGLNQFWEFDGLGNISYFDDKGSVQIRGVNAANEITSTTGIATPTYDRAGNMTCDGTQHYVYDAWNRLVKVQADESGQSGDVIAEDKYDGTGRRIEQLTDFEEGVPQNATHYFLSGQQVIETREGSPASGRVPLHPIYQYIWSPRYVDTLILRDIYNSSGELQPASRLFYLSDANYNVTALVGKVSNVWQVVERYAYSAYGKATIYTPDWSNTLTTSAYNNTTLYTGRTLDLVTGLYYYRARYYSADLGTFINRDPVGYGGGINLYEYVGDNPTNRTDPTGEIQWSWWPPDWFAPILPPPPTVSVPIRPIAGPSAASTAVKAADTWAKIRSAQCSKWAQCAALKAAMNAATGMYKKELAEIYALNCMGAGTP